MFRRTFTAALALGLGFAAACRPWRLLCAGRTRRHATFRRAACAAGAFSQPLCRCQANARQQRNGSEQELLRIALHCTFLSDCSRKPWLPLALNKNRCACQSVPVGRLDRTREAEVRTGTVPSAGEGVMGT